MIRGVMVVVIIAFLIVGNVFAEELESIVIGKDTLFGCFNNACSLSPGDTMYMALSGDGSNQVSWVWRYLGRTGEKTFDIQVTKPSASYKGPDKEITTFHYYFVPNTSIFLISGRSFPGCAKNDSVFLKISELKGSDIVFKIMLPSCAKK